MDERTPIPADLRRKVLVEAGHRCAIPTCRHIEVDVHHIVSWAECRTHEYENLIALCPNCHRRADRGDIDRKALRIYKLNLRYAHDKFSQIEMDVLFELLRTKPGQAIAWPPSLMVLLKRLWEARYIDCYSDDPGGFFSDGTRIKPDKMIFLTSGGRAFGESLGVAEL